MNKALSLKKLYDKSRKNPNLQSPDFKGRNFVPGEGNVDAQLMFIGEAPGKTEDIHQRPFIGRAGKLLTKTIEDLNLPRDQVFISNIVKFRPPNNRTPLSKEVKAFKELILKEIEIVNPQIICLLGATSTKAILGADKKISEVRGKIFKIDNQKMIPIYHPAYLLRNPKAMPGFIKDIKDAINRLNKA